MGTHIGIQYMNGWVAKWEEIAKVHCPGKSKYKSLSANA